MRARVRVRAHTHTCNGLCNCTLPATARRTGRIIHPKPRAGPHVLQRVRGVPGGPGAAHAASLGVRGPALSLNTAWQWTVHAAPLAVCVACPVYYRSRPVAGWRCAARLWVGHLSPTINGCSASPARTLLSTPAAADCRCGLASLCTSQSVSHTGSPARSHEQFMGRGGQWARV